MLLYHLRVDAAVWQWKWQSKNIQSFSESVLKLMHLLP